MPWVRVDDHFDEHPKFAAAGPLGIALWLAGMAYCNRNLTDGFIPWAVARSLLSWQFLGHEVNDQNAHKVYTVAVTSGHAGDDVDCPFVIDLLIDAKLWEEVEGGYRVHDYPDYQPSKNEVLAERGSSADRQRAWRERHKRTNGVDNAVSNAPNNGPVTVAPVPGPGPVPEKTKRDSSESPAESEEASPGDDRVDEVYGHFKARIQPKARLCPRKKIAARLKRFSAEELRQGIDHFAEDWWWMENNATQGAEWFFESDKRSEQFLLLQPRKAATGVAANGRASPPDAALREHMAQEFGYLATKGSA